MERGHLSERDAAVNARAILEVIRHCHSKCGLAALLALGYLLHAPLLAHAAALLWPARGAPTARQQRRWKVLIARSGAGAW